MTVWSARLAPLRKLLGYACISGLALGLDLTIYALLIKSQLIPTAAAAIGYVAGLFVHYVLSRSIVFKSERTGKEAAGEALGFVLTGIVGLAITAAVVAVCTQWLHTGPTIAKALAIGLSFFAVFLMRSNLVFANPNR